MPWFKVDDKLHSHKKAARAGEAMALWVVAGSWCADQLTDGFVPDYMVARLMPGSEAMAGRLVEAELWSEGEHDGDAGWWFKDWDDYQPTREDVENKREAARERMRSVRKNKPTRSGDVRANTPRSTEGSSPSPDPTRPVPKSKPLADADAPAGKPRDELFEEVAQQCGINWRNGLTKSERGELNNAVKQLRDVGATAVQVKARSASYRRKWPNVDLTPSALVKHWSKVDSRPPPDQGKAPEYDHDDAEARFRALTGGGN